MQLDVEPAPGVFAAEVRPSLLDLDGAESRGPEGRATSSSPASGADSRALWFSAPQAVGAPGDADYWEETADEWVRHHVQPRSVKFTPVGVRGAPPAEALQDDRETIMRDPGTGADLARSRDSWKRKDSHETSEENG